MQLAVFSAASAANLDLSLFKKSEGSLYRLPFLLLVITNDQIVSFMTGGLGNSVCAIGKFRMSHRSEIDGKFFFPIQSEQIVA